LNKLKYPSPYCLLCFLPWSIILPQHKNSDPKQTLGWNGKETAHQIGTPLSSLIGGEILKSENVDESTTIEIEKILSDYKPLQTVSQNWLRTHIRKDIVEETLQSYTYLQSLFKKY
jgi:hypothetical protein